MEVPIKVEHINPFLRATIETFQSMIRDEIKPGRISLNRVPRIHADVSGVIGLSGGAQGTVALSFPRITALKVVSEFGHMKVVTLDETVVDAVGELANIIAGAAKKDLAAYKINIALPTVVLGENHELAVPKDVIPMVVPFESKFGPFCLTVSFKSLI